MAIAAAHSASGDAGRLIGLDIGGSLCKLVFLEPRERPEYCDGGIATTIKSSETYGAGGIRDSTFSFEDDSLGGTIHFVHFPSDHMEGACQFVDDRGLQRKIQRIYTAGGGAHKYAAFFKERLNIELQPIDELAVVVRGISWMAEHVREEVYSLDVSSGTRQYLEPGSLFPFLLVNIGSGVSIVRVDGSAVFERVSGTALGGGTFWGLCCLLTGCSSFKEAMDLAAEGDASSVNLLVKDIYGGDYKLPSGAKLDGSLTASFFAKAQAAHSGEDTTEDAKSDRSGILRAMATMIAQNICQLAYLNAQLQGAERVVFTGNFLRHNMIAQSTIARSMQRQSLALLNGRQMQALFLKHEGYFGALGSLLHGSSDCADTIRSKRVLDAEAISPRDLTNKRRHMEDSVVSSLDVVRQA